MARPKKKRLSQRERHRLALAPVQDSQIAIASGGSSLTWGGQRLSVLGIRNLGAMWGAGVGHDVEEAAGQRAGGSEILIESLDEGATWHTTDTMEPAANLDGRLVLGTAPAGLAPECMRPGSGVYRFSISVRRATEDEERAWIEENHARTVREAEAGVEQARTWIEVQASKKKAKRRALELLLSHLTPRQRDDFAALGGFWVTSQLGNLYWVTLHTAIRFGLNDVAIQAYCIYPVDPDGRVIPEADKALARMLLLKCDEEAFLRTANPSPPNAWLARPRIPDPDLATPEQLAAMEQAAMQRAVQYREMALRPMRPYLININGMVRGLCG